MMKTLYLLCGLLCDSVVWEAQAHEQMAEFVPHSILRLIYDGGHMSMMEQPDLVLSALEEWLALPVPAA
ncbi:MAG: hypothetical protein A3E79_19390 [Burkholderiales bacterium RIFCSPHIGHO2_12_FULL_61_11]|nr:MAG: hypothetical protein A3E79_19390 [Burkholderiales bacterium RIFCSPHIGHO2_12_FULL_61_11]